MYCTYENKYKLWRDLWITVVTPPPVIVHVSVMKEWRTNDVSLVFYFARSRFRPTERRTLNCRHFCYVLPSFNVTNCEEKSVALRPNHEWVSFICVCLHIPARLATKWPLTVLYSGLKNCTCPVNTRQVCVCGPFHVGMSGRRFRCVLQRSLWIKQACLNAFNWNAFFFIMCCKGKKRRDQPSKLQSFYLSFLLIFFSLFLFTFKQLHFFFFFYI